MDTPLSTNLQFYITCIGDDSYRAGGVFDIAINQHALLEASYSAERTNLMLIPIVTYVGTINVIQNRKDLILVTDPLEVKWILDYLGYPAVDDGDQMDFSGLFVSIRDGDYGEVLAFEGCVPYLYKDLWQIESQ